MAKTFDEFDNIEERRSVVYARNACFDLAKQLGYTYFLELDDDYKEFQFRYVDGDALRLIYPLEVDSIFDAMLDYYKSIPAKAIAMAQNDDFLGGVESGNLHKKILRKAMNTFFCSVERPFKFIGRINEDVNSYCYYGSQGDLFLTLLECSINQEDSQTNKGGMTDAYNAIGTYTKSFYSVLCCPSSVSLAVMISKHPRIHHAVNWETCVPKIISDRFKIKE